MKLNRRQFIGAAVGMAAASIAAPTLLRAQGDGTVQATLTVHPDREIVRVPENYTGLSYESAQLANPNFFSPANTDLIGFFRRLGTGVLRIGGNTSEYANWSLQGVSFGTGGDVGAPDTGGKTHRYTTTTPEAIRNLAGFLDKTGWQLIYGLNLGNGTPEAAGDEAAYVWQVARRHVLTFQIGNEPDLFNRNGLRPSTYGFPEYFAEWQRFAAAIRARVPDAPLAGPDIAYKVDWVQQFAAQAEKTACLLTGHYYALGPPTNPAMNIDRLLSPNPKLIQSMAGFMQASKQSGLPYRMAEGNSCYNGGKQGVSDTFASALWGGDYMLQVAQAGYVGVNFHGGGRGWYTPIASDAGGLSARPLYYGMLLAGQFAGATLLQVDFDAGGANATAYAAKKGNQLLAAIFNKEANRPIHVDIKRTGFRDGWTSIVLAAPALDSTSGVTFGNGGFWTPVSSGTGGGWESAIDLTPASAQLVQTRLSIAK